MPSAGGPARGGEEAGLEAGRCEGTGGLRHEGLGVGRSDLPLGEELVAVLHHLVRAADEVEVMLVEELGHDVRTKRVRDAWARRTGEQGRSARTNARRLARDGSRDGRPRQDDACAAGATGRGAMGAGAGRAGPGATRAGRRGAHRGRSRPSPARPCRGRTREGRRAAPGRARPWDA